MAHMVLGIGYHTNEREAVCNKWREYGVVFHFAESTEEAIESLRRMEYICITICIGNVSVEQLHALRSIGPTPIVVLSPDCSISKRAEIFQRGALDFIIKEHHLQKESIIAPDAVQYYLNHTHKATKPLTIITTEDVYFCLESREVEVRGKRIDLTTKEFDILALLILNPKLVFTFDMMADMVWNEGYSFYSRKTLANHISNLRKKMKVLPDVPNYIVSIHGIGYRFAMG